MISLPPRLLVAIAFAAIVLGAVVGFAITRARRLDRSYQRILVSRDSLSYLLLHRVSEADLLTRSVGLKNFDFADAVCAYIQDGGDQLITDGLGRRAAAQRQGNRVGIATRLEHASALPRAIRETLIPDERARIASDPQASVRLETLDATCYRIELMRNVYNVDVAGVRALRFARMVKSLQLAGHVPIPEPIDFDDDTRTGGRGY